MELAYLIVNVHVLTLHRVLILSFAISTPHYHLNGNLYIGFDHLSILQNPCFDNLRISRVGHNYKNKIGLSLLLDFLT